MAEEKDAGGLWLKIIMGLMPVLVAGLLAFAVWTTTQIFALEVKREQCMKELGDEVDEVRLRSVTRLASIESDIKHMNEMLKRIDARLERRQGGD